MGMIVIVNGKPIEVPPGHTVADLIADMGRAGQACAAEVNHEVVPRRQHDQRVLREGDTVELVTLVGGG